MARKYNTVAIATVLSVLAGPAFAGKQNLANELRDSGRSVPEVNLPAPHDLPTVYPIHVSRPMPDVSAESDDFQDQQ